ncbi:MAG: FAD-dependent oxidoreductase [Pseudomonadota bacterium]
MERVVVVGAGQSGSALVAKLRLEGYTGAVTLIGDEDEPPYQRPPLSKAYLLGELEKERLYLRPHAFYAENEIDLVTGTAVTGIDRVGRAIRTEAGDYPYDALVLTTGSRARALPDAIGGALDGVVTVRSLGDVHVMEPLFREHARVLIIGGGYIGLEAAAVAAKLGLKVTLIEQEQRILKRVAAPITSEFFRDLHVSHGVDLREAVGLERLLGEKDTVKAAVLTDGSEIEVDFVVTGIGIHPEDRLAAAAGLETDRGIVVDRFGRTSDPNIWAAGDCTVFEWRGAPTRLESVQNAIDQAEVVAKNLLGAEEPYDPKPWFWSDQFDVKLQIAGLNRGFDQVVVRPGERDGAVSHWYYGAGELVAVDAMNDPRAYMVGKRLVDAGRSPDPDQVADPDVDLKTLLRG